MILNRDWDRHLCCGCRFQYGLGWWIWSRVGCEDGEFHMSEYLVAGLLLKDWTRYQPRTGNGISLYEDSSRLQPRIGGEILVSLRVGGSNGWKGRSVQGLGRETRVLNEVGT